MSNYIFGPNWAEGDRHMPRPLLKTDVVERLHVLPLENYALIANVAKGIALGVAALVLLEILAKINVEWMATAAMVRLHGSYSAFVCEVDTRHLAFQRSRKCVGQCHSASDGGCGVRVVCGSRSQQRYTFVTLAELALVFGGTRTRRSRPR